MPKILADSEQTSSRTRNIVWAVGAMHRGSFSKDLKKQDWSVEEPRWLVAAETPHDAIREIAREHAANLSRACWDAYSQRCLYIMRWERYHTEPVAPEADIEQITLPDSLQVVRYHRRWN